MKNKTKKILASIGLGVMLGGGALITTACSSDITFNQADLDKTIANMNEYLEYQNNYSSEFSYNSLMDNIMMALENNVSTNNFSINTNIAYYDNHGIQIRSKQAYGKRFVTNDNIVKFYVKESAEYEGEEEIENYFVMTKDFTNNNYNGVSYNLKNNTYINYDNIKNTDNLSAIAYPKDLLTGAFIMACKEDVKVIMDEVSNNEYKYKILTADEESMMSMWAEIVFKEGKIVKFKAVEASSSVGDGNVSVWEYNISYDVTDFTYNVENFTKAKA